MGKYPNDCGNSYNANRAAGSGCNANRSGDQRRRGCEAEYARRCAEPCCEREQAERYACNYVWRGTARPCSENEEADYETCPVSLHLHEVQGSVQVAGENCRAHGHRFATVTCEPVILKNGRHAHKLTFRTDAYDGHCHEFSGCTAENVEICEGHVHYLEGRTSENAGHCHEFRCITHIENPTGE